MINKNSTLLKWVIATYVLCLTSCLPFDEETTLKLGDDKYALAVPLIDSRIDIASVINSFDDNISMRIDKDGKITLLYLGDVLRRSSAAIFPPFPGLISYPILDTIWKTELLPVNRNNILVREALFKGTKIAFELEHEENENLIVNVRINEVTQNGKSYTRTFFVPYNGGTKTSFITTFESIDKWNYASGENKITFSYEAKTVSGKKVVLPIMQMRFDVFEFSFVKGYLGYHIDSLRGSFIDIPLFNKWVSGGFQFEDPKISINVENSFGIPVRSKVDQMDLTTINGNIFKLQSSFIDDGINFDFPTLNEVGKSKVTTFFFDKNNSNINTLFKEKVNKVTYRVYALVNPERDTSLLGFITDSSFYRINVAAELPLQGTLNDFRLKDTFKISKFDAPKFEDINLRIVVSNEYPISINLEVSSLKKSDNGYTSTRILEKGDFIVKASTLDNNLKTVKASKHVIDIPLTNDVYEEIKQGTEIEVIANFNSLENGITQPIWIYNNYGLDLKVGIQAKSN